MTELVCIIIIIWFTFGDPEWLGRHLSNTKGWYDYYQQKPNQNIHKAIVKRRAKNIKRIRNERFKKSNI